MSAAKIPIPSAPLVDRAGMVSRAWLQFLTDLWARTGGDSGDVVGTVGDEADSVASDLNVALGELQARVDQIEDALPTDVAGIRASLQTIEAGIEDLGNQVALCSAGNAALAGRIETLELEAAQSMDAGEIEALRRRVEALETDVEFA